MHGFAVLALLVAVLVSVSAQGGEEYGHHHLEEYTDYRSPPRYSYDYKVRDHHTHDFHDQWEKREGDDTRGEYSLIQPDGRRRVVKYRVGKHGADYRIKYEGESRHGGIGRFEIGY